MAMSSACPGFRRTMPRQHGNPFLASTKVRKTSIDRAGFIYPEGLVRDERRRSNALTHVIALTVLIASLAVVVTTVSFGMANATDRTVSAAPGR